MSNNGASIPFRDSLALGSILVIPAIFRVTSLVLTEPIILGILDFHLPKWRNRQTRATQTRVPLRIVGSIPTFGIEFISTGPGN